MSAAREEMPAGFLLGCAGVAAMTAAACVTGDWDHVAVPGIVAATLAIGLALAGLAQARRQGVTDAVPGRRRRLMVRMFLAAMALHLVTAVSMELAVTGADIDTYTFQKEACRRLLHGQNPYGGTQENLYNARDTGRYYGPDVVRDGRVQVGLQYPPLTVLWTLPGYALGDVRFSYVAAVMLTAWMLYEISAVGAWVGLVLLLNPLTFYVENRCFTEPLALAMLALTVLAALRRSAWTFVALGLLVGAKQYNFLVIPLGALLVRPFAWREYLSLMVKALGVTALTLLPFAVWDWRALVHDLVWFHLAQPFRPDAVSLAVLVPQLTKVGVAFWAGLLGWVVWRAPRRAGLLAAGYGTVMLVFVATSKQAFANYYWMLGYALLLGCAAMGTRADGAAGREAS
jgi:hypothetical protein